MLKMNILVFLLLSIAVSALPQEYKGSIIRVIDGDTFVFQIEKGSFTVRMYGTDAPERDQPFSKESADFLNQYKNKDAVFRRQGTDRYGRTLGRLYIDGQDINLLSIKGGYSWHFKRYSTDQDYASAEKHAKTNNLGLWSMPSSIPPWNWRK
jgi:micrococcal nuclease